MFVDTSVIIEILRHQKTSDRFRLIKESIGAEELYISVIQLAELSDWCIENKAPTRERVEIVKRFASVVPLDEEVCLEGSKIKAERRRGGLRNFSLMDGLLLATARSLSEKVLTFDRDFQGEKDCIVLA